ncbi:MAG: hypothetical protein ACOH2F_02125 [Cellulomonas sp.]
MVRSPPPDSAGPVADLGRERAGIRRHPTDAPGPGADPVAMDILTPAGISQADELNPWADR